MTLNIKSPDLTGLSYLAGKANSIQLNPTGALGLQAYQTQQAGNIAAQNNATEQMKIQQQGQLALQQQSIQQRGQDMQAAQAERQGLLQQNDQSLRQQQYGIQNGQAKDDLAYKQQALAQQLGISQDDQAIKKQAQAQDQQKLEFAKLLDEKKDTLQAKGAFASYGLLALKNAKSPEEAQQVSDAIFKEAADKKYLTPDMADNLNKLPLSQRMSWMQGSIISAGMAQDVKATMEAGQPKGNAANAGTNIKFNSDGSIQEITQNAGTKLQSKMQGELADREQALANLAPIRNEFNEKYFTYKNQGEIGLDKIAEKTKGIPIVGSALDSAAQYVSGGKDPEQRAEDIKGATKYLNAVEQFFQIDYRKPVTGAAAALAELNDLRKNFINGSMSPSEFRGALDGVLQRYTSESEFKKNILNQGLDTRPATDEGLRSFFKSKGKSDAEIDNYFKKGAKQ